MSIGRRSTRALLAVVGLLAAAVFAQSAGAIPPTSEDVNFTGTTALAAGELCSFPIEFDAATYGRITTFYDSDGAVVKRVGHEVEQDSFSANGKTLVGEPYPYEFIAEFENGVRVSRYFQGIAERVNLPDGGVFIIAGRVYFNHPGTILTVDSGNSGNNADAFCEALS
jgi:hypothetical protein